MDLPPTSRKTKPFFRYDPIVSIGILLAVFFVSQIAAGFLVSLYPAVRSWTEGEALSWLRNSVVAEFVYRLLVAIIAIGLVFKVLSYAKVLKARIGLVRPRFGDVGWAFVSYGIYFLTYLGVVTIVAMLIPAIDTTQKQQIGFETAQSVGHLLLVFVSLVILPPLTEEIMFRGFLYSSLRTKYGVKASVVVSSALFGIAHLQFGANAPLLWIAAIDTFVLACFLSYLREKTGSIWASVFLHAIKNCIAFVVLFGGRFLYLI